MGTINKNLLFYKIMNYPIPTQSDIFLFEKKSNNTNNINQEFSRNKKNEFMDKFIKKINKH
jgi:hypothetical protein